MKSQITVKKSGARPFSGLLSQTLVAFTLELDNEFEKRMSEVGYPGAHLSLVVWLIAMQFVADGPLSVRDLSIKAVVPEERIKFLLGCLERWRYVSLSPASSEDQPILLVPHRRAGRDLRDGWGSGRGIRVDWVARPTSKGLKASSVWRPLPDEIERRWQERFGRAEIIHIRELLTAVVSQLDVNLPQGLYFEWRGREVCAFPPREEKVLEQIPFASLLSQALLAFALEFDRESSAPLPLCANILRVLSEKPVRAADIPFLTGGSPETSGVGWETEPFVVEEPDPASRRGKVVRLTQRGLDAQRTYLRLVDVIEAQWEAKFGASNIRQLRNSLQTLFEQRDGDRPLMALGLVPSPGGIRSGTLAPALGRRAVAAAAKKRVRDMVVQTETFLQDPAGRLPHFPLWDMNRGFGP